MQQWKPDGAQSEAEKEMDDAYIWMYVAGGSTLPAVSAVPLEGSGLVLPKFPAYHARASVLVREQIEARHLQT